MTRQRILLAVFLAGFAGATGAVAQTSTFPPFFIEMTVNVSDDNGIFLYSRTINFEDNVFDDLVFGDTLNEIILEGYLLDIDVKIGDVDISETQPNFWQRRSTLPATFESPTPPVFEDGQDSPNLDLTPNAQNPAIGTSPGGDPRWELKWSYNEFAIPEFNGTSQRRLQGSQVYDVGWFMKIEISDTENPAQDVILQSKTLTIYARENPGLRPGDPPPFADAGGNSTVSRNPLTGDATVRLNSNLTFDATNVGFDAADPRIFEKNEITYEWELISYPAGWTPNYTFDIRDPRSPIATVRLRGTQVGQIFEFRVLARDGANPTPSSAVVQIVISDPVAANRAPTASAGNDLTVGVGGTITLDGVGSTDPDGDSLTYLWRQTNAVGGALSADQVATAFQPVSGLSAVRSTWRAVAVGTYYFRLIVSDPGGDSDYDDIVVVVNENAGSPARELNSSDGSLDTTATLPLFGGLCGAGLMPVALVPFMLLPLRKRIR